MDEAKRISLAIDASLKAERIARRKKRIVRLLLLGQSESGKSTTLRQFQRLYTPTAFREERFLWRAVIQLNIVRSIRTILDATTPSSQIISSRISNPLKLVESLLISKLLQQQDSSTTHFSVSSPQTIDPFDHLSDDDDDDDDYYHDDHTLRQQRSYSSSPSTRTRVLANATNNQEISIRLGPGWKGVFANARVDSSSSSDNSNNSNNHSPTSSPKEKDEAQEILYSLRADMIQLWHDPGIRDILKKRKIRLEESSGFFLDDIERVTSLRFLPTDDDVLKARLKTVGVSEYKFEIELGAGRDTGTEWRIVDVGGSRTQRPTWVPFFDDVDAILFLAPISAFDQVLSEDRTINRLEDSVLLWKAVCSSKLLSRVDLILFLNKCDILERKLGGGVKMAKYVRNYGDRPNDLESVSKYLRGKFSAIHREYSPLPRKFYAFCTSVTDTSTTSGIIASVRDMVIRQHLRSSKLL